jgi:predicted esterase
MAHYDNPIIQIGTPLASATGAMVMIHGRGSNPDGILALTSHFRREGMAFLAPTADNGTWYPQRFLVPRRANEPYLSQALQTIDALVGQIAQAGIPIEKTLLLGFSQGACLALEYAIRHPRRYGSVVGLSGALIGADDELTGYVGGLDGVPIFLGCSDVDMHIPVERVHTTQTLFEAQGAVVTKRIYPNFGHTVNMDEIEAIREMVARVES